MADDRAAKAGLASGDDLVVERLDLGRQGGGDGVAGLGGEGGAVGLDEGHALGLQFGLEVLLVGEVFDDREHAIEQAPADLLR
mgnify:CR=1 FL=1